MQYKNKSFSANETLDNCRKKRLTEFLRTYITIFKFCFRHTSIWKVRQRLKVFKIFIFIETCHSFNILILEIWSSEACLIWIDERINK